MTISFNFDKKVIKIASMVFLVVLVTGLVMVAQWNGWLPGNKVLSGVVANKTLDYINTNLLTNGQKATLNSVSEEAGLIKINLSVNGSAFDSYITKDGKFLFPSAPIVIGGSNTSNSPQPQTGTQTPKNLTKVDNTLLEAYIVSQCPYGLQMQRAMVDAIQNIPSLAQHIKVRYMGAVTDGKITAMHGDKEAQENLRQICIREEESPKYWSYVACYMKNGDSAGCQKTSGVDNGKLSTCMTDPKRGLTYAQADFDLNTKYGVTGSPTLILNGTRVSEFDFGGRSSDAVRKIVCDSSTTAPASCDKVLTTTAAAVAYSTTYASAGSAGAAAGSGANCAPATPQ